MISLSSRHALVMTLLLIAPAALSVHQLVWAPRAETCVDPAALMQKDFLPDLRDVHAVTGQTGDFVDMANGTLAIFGLGPRPPEWRIVRTYDLFEYYFVPRRTFNPIHPDDLTETLQLEIDGQSIPVHTRIHLDPENRHQHFTAYYFVLGGAPVRDPFTGALDRARQQLTGGPDALTVFMVGGTWPERFAEERQRRLMEWLGRSWSRYDAACNP